MGTWYQYLPYEISPIAFTIGGFEVRWYSFMFLLAILTVYGILIWRAKQKEVEWKKDWIDSYFAWVILGIIVGGRLGYALLYDPAYFISSPSRIIFPFDSSGEWIGIYGMSYYGGLIGVVLATWLFSKKKRINFWDWMDYVVVAVPLGYFWGRIGNFLNGELYGRVTESILGMYFPADLSRQLRHPSQIYEALLEGILLFVILWLLRSKKLNPGALSGIYLLGYGVARFTMEFYRNPDIGDSFKLGITRSQIFSVIAILVAVAIILSGKRRKKMIQ